MSFRRLFNRCLCRSVFSSRTGQLSINQRAGVKHALCADVREKFCLRSSVFSSADSSPFLSVAWKNTLQKYESVLRKRFQPVRTLITGSFGHSPVHCMNVQMLRKAEHFCVQINRAQVPLERCERCQDALLLGTISASFQSGYKSSLAQYIFEWR